MRTLLAWGPGPFLVGKLALTTAGVWGIVAVRGRRLFGTRLRVGHILLGLGGVYGLVAVYELVLLILHRVTSATFFLATVGNWPMLQ